MKLLNQIKYRVALSVILGIGYSLISNFWTESFDFSLFAAVSAAVIVYIPLTILWAIISTFFMDEDSNDSSDDVIDR